MNKLVPNLKFIFSGDRYDNSEVVIYGFPLDTTTVFRPGTRFAPNKIREMSYALETYSPVLKKDLSEASFYDLGNNYTPFEPMYDLDKTLAKARDDINSIVKEGKKLVVLGGEHLVSYPIVETLVKRYPELVVLHFDAHADLRNEYDGSKLSHATVMRRIVEIVGADNLYQFGIRSGIAEEFKVAKNLYTELVNIEKTIKEIQDYPIYISIDIDVFDPAFAPGTGTPEPGGCTPQEFFRALYKTMELNVVGVDLVEISPPYDHSDITSLLGAKIIREILLAFRTSF